MSKNEGVAVRVIWNVLILMASPLAFAAEAPATFPAQQRLAGDPAVVARGSALYAIHCRSCHGVDLRGGDLGGPNLLRSQLILGDQAGEAVVPLVQNGRTTPGAGTMPALPLAVSDIKAVAEYLHSVIATSQPQGAPPAGPQHALNLLVGSARAGRRYFEQQCQDCHSVTGDLAGIGSRVPNPELLQNSWVSARRSGPADPQADPTPRQVRVRVDLAGGESVSGSLQRIDDFVVSLVTSDGEYRSFTRRSATPRITAIEIKDPLERHHKLFSLLTDKSMHDVTAYLVTLK
jgi:cytochrome c oxidase cbb3-type subunit III